MKGIIPDYFRKIADYAGISYEFLTPATRDEYIAYQKIRILQILASMHAWKQITMLRRKMGDYCTFHYNAAGKGDTA